jgi:hypothetical protein
MSYHKIQAQTLTKTIAIPTECLDDVKLHVCFDARVQNFSPNTIIACLSSIEFRVYFIVSPSTVRKLESKEI